MRKLIMEGLTKSSQRSGGGNAKATLSVRAPRVTDLSFNPPSVRAGDATIGTSTINSPAPAGGILINLTTANEARLPVPTQVKIIGGQTSATFTATHSPGPARNVKVTAAYGSDSNAAFTVSIYQP